MLPLLILYINDISLYSLVINYIDTHYVNRSSDDNSIAINNANNNKINDNLTIISNWSINNKLQLNISKTKYFTYIIDNIFSTRITLNNQIINYVKQYKSIEPYIDNKLKYKNN